MQLEIYADKNIQNCRYFRKKCNKNLLNLFILIMISKLRDILNVKQNIPCLLFFIAIRNFI